MDVAARKQHSHPWSNIQLCGSDKRQAENPGYYRNLLAQNSDKTTYATQQIEKDLLRTFVNNPLMSSKSGVDSLNNVLRAYAFHNKATGYCQALNFLAALLLLILPEEAAFWTLVCLLERYLANYYTFDLAGSKVS